MKVAMLGTRGVPAAYSGFETCVEAVGKRLAARGHEVTVYCRSGAAPHSYLGMRLVRLPALRTKGLETLSHTLLSSVHTIARERPDAAVVFGVGNALFCRPLRWAGVPVAINVDGPDWNRRKWGALGRRWLRWSEHVAGHAANVVIADSKAVETYYAEQYRIESTFIPYGADIPAEIGTATLDKFGLRSRAYLLSVGRFVPENGFHHLIQAYAEVHPEMPFVIVGDAPYSEAYKKQLKVIAPAGVIFTGYQFGDAYHELSHHAYAFLFAGEIGGTHPVLVEQLAHGNCVLARWTKSNAEVIDDAGMYFANEAELAEKLRLIVDDRATVERLRKRARERAEVYSWERVTDQYEDLLKQLARAPSPARA
jgi:glycosyltransferase involved in cell wall biosynthesis